jgi:hypothetical protein
MTTPTNLVPSVRRPGPVGAGDRRAVRLPAGADAKLFGGWGVRF